MLSTDDIQRIIMENPKRYKEILLKMSPETVEFIDKEFPQLSGFKFATKVYWHLHGMSDFPTYVCPVCGNTQYLNRDVFSVIDGYNRWLNRTGCSYECSQNNPETIEKKKRTNKDRFGVEYSSQRDSHQKKCKDAWDNMTSGKKLQTIERRKHTSKERYGVDHYSKTKEFLDRIQQTNKDRFGVPYASQSQEIREQIDDVFMKHYGGNPLSLEYIRQKGNATCMKKYNVEWFQQSSQFFKSKRHKYKSERYPELSFDSKWEMQVYQFCKDCGIQVEYSPKISYEYEYDGKTHTYHPDFLINGRIYEVKGDQFFRTNEETGKEEMFCPYRNPKWTDLQYNWMCGMYEAKHQCMKDNGVVILRSNELHNLKEVFNHVST